MTDKDPTFAESLDARRPSANWLYFRRFLAHPGRLFSIIPSSGMLSRLVADQVRRSADEFVVELGAGTGAITRALLFSGVPADKLIAVEIDGQMARFLRRMYPDITVIEGDALDVGGILPPSVIGRVGTVICGIPVSPLSPGQQRELARVIFSLMPVGRRFLAYSHRIGSPFREKEAALVGKRLAFTLRNVPPASVWSYEPDSRG